MHPDQLTVTAKTVRALVDRQFPKWRELPVRAVRSHGTVNALFRLGDALVARLPLVPSDVDATRRWLEAEADAGRELVGRTRFPTPEPVALGEPGDGYPMPWSVQTWLPGTIATDDDPGASPAFAHDSPSSSPTCGRSRPAAGRSAGAGAAAACPSTTTGCGRAWSAVTACSTSRRCAARGPSSARSRATRAPTS